MVFTLEQKKQCLQSLLRGYGSVAIGFSGGVDSSFLLSEALVTLGASKVLAVIADTPSLPRQELAEAIKLAVDFGATYLVVEPHELRDPAYAGNSIERCYFCKRALFKLIAQSALEKGFKTVLDGNNADDACDYRPGGRAALELGVQSPLQAAGLTKDEIRKLSVRAGLPTATKPAMACLASRIPYGTPISAEVLLQVERAEAVLHQQGFADCRVRHHGEIARIEIPPQDFARILEEATREAIIAGVKAVGYGNVTIDLQGYRRGSLNEGVVRSVQRT